MPGAIRCKTSQQCTVWLVFSIHLYVSYSVDCVDCADCVVDTVADVSSSDAADPTDTYNGIISLVGKQCFELCLHLGLSK